MCTENLQELSGLINCQTDEVCHNSTKSKPLNQMEQQGKRGFSKQSNQEPIGHSEHQEMITVWW